MIISFVNQKGGVGKTTTAINFAASLKRKNFNPVLIDADPQGSAIQWHAVESNKVFEILHYPQILKYYDIEALQQNYDMVVIDAPPAHTEITRSILAITNMAIVPVSPSSLDIWACWRTMELIKEAQTDNPDLDIKLLINRKISGTTIGREARSALEIFDTEIMDTELCQRVADMDALTSGVSVVQYAPSSKAADEIVRLCDELIAEAEAEAIQSTEPQDHAEAYQREAEKPIWQKIYEF